MTRPTILVSGAGISGAAASLCLAQRGFQVRLFERAPIIHEFGAGLQLSPNATAILKQIGVLRHVTRSTVQPESVRLRNISSLKQIAEVPLGKDAEARYGSPYLVMHRGDLQAALVDAVKSDPRIEIMTGWKTTGFMLDQGSVTLIGNSAQTNQSASGDYLIAADGIWSSLARNICGDTHQRFLGYVAWRRTVSEDDPLFPALISLAGIQSVNAFLHPKAHLICYPIQSGKAFNLVAFGPGHTMPPQWNNPASASEMREAFRGAHPTIMDLFADTSEWTAWPIWGATGTNWLHEGRVAIIGDAAHAMTPFAAQGAAMGIEDAFTIAAALRKHFDGDQTALPAWQTARRERIARVQKRARLNSLAWHASGPVALARDLVLRFKGPDKLLADMDWLYGWKPD